MVRVCQQMMEGKKTNTTHWKKQSMLGEEELLGHFFLRTFPFCFVLRLFHEMERDVFPSLISYSDVVSLLLPAAEIMGLTVVFKTRFPFKSFTSVSSQPSCMVPYDCGLPSLVQEILLKTCYSATPHHDVTACIHLGERSFLGSPSVVCTVVSLHS